MDKNNVLFVGNGIDLLDGYKTDYVSFLLSEKENYKNLFIKGVEKNLLSKRFIKKALLVEKKVDLYEYIRMAYINDHANELTDEFRSYIIEEKKEMSKGKVNLKSLGVYNGFKQEMSLDIKNKFFIAKNLKKEDVENVEIPNIWISYFIKCYLDGVLSGENWIDLEGLIFKNGKKLSSEKSDLEYTIFEHKDKFYDEDIDIYEHYVEMKTSLCIYLENAKKTQGKLRGLRSKELNKYGTRLNFNYSESRLLPYDNNTEDTPDEFFIHGTTTDLEKIVFGYDDGMLTNVETKEYEYANKDLYKMSKTYQLLELSLRYQNEKIEQNFKIPQANNIKYIGILGHSISEADYNYFSTLCDFDNVIIEVFWYWHDINDENGDFVKKVNNQMSLMNNLISMIHEMERQSKTKILHRMLIEQRIVFRELKYR